MKISPESLYKSPNTLAGDYSRFRVGERLLLTGHSHQAWPDKGFDGQKQAWLDAAVYVDKKWEHAFAQAEEVRRGYSRLLEDSSGDIALGANTHELVVKFLSGLPLQRRPKIITTDGEFHSIRRQVDRLAEENVTVEKVPADPVSSIAERLVSSVDNSTAAVLVSAVLFSNARIVPGLGAVMGACAKAGAELLVDAYHALNVVPFSIEKEGLKGAFVVGGGYKYCQLGEGNGFLRVPGDKEMRPVITGWFAEFDTLSTRRGAGRVPYGRGASRFAGATYDPTSHYRAAKVFEFFEERGLTPSLLRRVSQHQVGLLARLFDDLDLDPRLVGRDREVSLEHIGGFLVLRSPRAPDLCRQLEAHGVYADFRGEKIRLGPAPYLCDDQLENAMDILGVVARSLV